MVDRRKFLETTAWLAFTPAWAAAQDSAVDFPTRPVTMVVPFAVGQSGDILARIVSEAIAKQWKRPMIVDNKGGAGGTVGSVAVARAPADGYTLLMGSSGPTAIAPSLYRNVGYDPNNDFTPIINVAGVAQVLLVPAGSSSRSVQELIGSAKSNPGKLNYGSGGKGSTAHLTMELFKSQAGISFEHVPYKGAGPAYPDLIAGRLDAMFDTTPAALPFLKSGQLRALAVSTARRSPALPDVPTLQEAGLPDYELVAWWGIVGPAGMSPELRGRLNRDLREVLDSADVRLRLEGMGMVVLAGPSDEFKRFIRSEHEKFAALIKANGISVDQ
jgi:tripartite-type tricarboxylate transporter receptor subunit TctC